MRIISGKYRSRRIIVPSGRSSGQLKGFRPTTGRARETLFNILSARVDIQDMKCLDLFAGTGSFGFECLSRGAGSCDFVEISGQLAKLVERTAEELKCKDQVSVFRNDAFSFLRSRPDEFYDLIFADPPYAFEMYEKLLGCISGMSFGVFALESRKKIQHGFSPEKFDSVERRVGVTYFTVLISRS